MDSSITAYPPAPGRSRTLPWLLAVGLFGLVLAGAGLGIYGLSEGASPGIPELGAALPPAEAAALAALVQEGPGQVDIDAPHHMAMDMDAMPSQSDQEALAAELALATAAVPNYRTVAAAAAAGYIPVSPPVDGIGSHWIKWSLVAEPFDLQAPSQLLFEEVRSGQGPELVAFSYWVRSDGPPEGFTGQTDQWHRHLGLCFEDGWLKTESVPDRESCSGDWIEGSNLWMLHAWIVPGLENRFGVFHTTNPLLCERFCE